MRKKGAGLFLMTAALIILFPTLGHLLPDPAGEGDLNENRALASWPVKAKTIQKYLAGVENWFNDHLAFREQLIEANLKMDLSLGESPSSSVLLGKNGMLFYCERDENQDVRREIVLSESDQESVVEVQTERQAELQSEGAAYYVLVAPNKQTIYPEYLPLSVQVGEGPSRLDQIYNLLKAETDVPVIDVRPSLQAAKKDFPVYYLYDSHWSETGTRAVFADLALQLKADFPDLYIPADAEIRATPGTHQGDLSGMIGMYEEYTEACEYYDFPNSRVYIDSQRTDDSKTVYVNPDHPESPKILLIHDSFGPALTTFLKESAGELYVTTSESSGMSILQQEKPDIVIYEIVERYAMALGAY